MDAEDIIMICVSVATLVGGVVTGRKSKKSTGRKVVGGRLGRVLDSIGEEEPEVEQEEPAADREPVLAPEPVLESEPVIEEPEAEGVSAVHSRVETMAEAAEHKPAAEVLTEPEEKRKKIDPRLLVVYSEIMKPKFDEGLE